MIKVTCVSCGSSRFRGVSSYALVKRKRGDLNSVLLTCYDCGHSDTYYPVADAAYGGMGFIERLVARVRSWF